MVHCPSRKQRGQAAAETLVLILGLAVLWVAVAWLARVQDMALQASSGARYAAFLGTRDDLLDAAPAVRETLFSGPGALWQDLRGQHLRETVYPELALSLERSAGLAAADQVGGAAALASRLRSEWAVEDKGLLTARARLVPVQAHEQVYPRIRRQVAIATHAGHSPDDPAVARRIAQSSVAWSSTVNASVSAGRAADVRLRALDAAWGRSGPDYDWLMPWAGELPSWHLGGQP